MSTHAHRFGRAGLFVITSLTKKGRRSTSFGSADDLAAIFESSSVVPLVLSLSLSLSLSVSSVPLPWLRLFCATAVSGISSG